MTRNADVPVFILAGGLGTRLKEHTEFRPKPMVEIGGKPILWHIMRSYSRHGFKRFVICSGFKSEVIKDYFANYDLMNSDFTVNLKTRNTTYHCLHHDEDWEVTVAYTGELTMTGGRIGRAAEKYLGNAEHFAVTYGDGVTNADLDAEFRFHQEHGRIGTVLAINPPSRFGDLITDGDTVLQFSEKPELTKSGSTVASSSSAASSPIISGPTRIWCSKKGRLPPSRMLANSAFGGTAASGPAWTRSATVTNWTASGGLAKRRGPYRS
jgi:glucose-1-phosphate cytidylyltransferase